MKKKAAHLLTLVRAMLPMAVCTLLMAMAAARSLGSLYIKMPGATIGALMQNVLGGPSYDMFMELDTVMNWLLALMPPLAGLVLYIQRATGQQLVLSLYRYGSKHRFMLWQLSALFMYVIICTLLMSVSIIITGFLSGLRGLHVFISDSIGFISRQHWPVLFAMLCYTMQSLMLLLLFIFFYLSFNNLSFGVLMFMLPVIWGLLNGSNEENLSSPEVFINWGMASRYALVEGQFGVPLGSGLLRQAGLILALVITNLASITFVQLSERKKIN